MAQHAIATPSKISSELCIFLGLSPGSEIARTVFVKKLSQYIKDNNLKNGRVVLCDEKLKKLLPPKEAEVIQTFFSLCKKLSIHFLPKTKASALLSKL